MKYIQNTLAKVIAATFVSLFLLVPSYTLAQVSDIAPVGGETDDSCTELLINFGYRSSDQGTSGSVSRLQDFLISKNYLQSESTGYFGGMTLKAVKAYQTSKGFGATGYVGNYTRAAVKKDSCTNTAQTVIDNAASNTNTTSGSITASNGGVGYTGSTIAGVVKGRVLNAQGRASTLAYLKCGNRIANDYVAYSPNQAGDVVFNTEVCRQKGGIVWVSCPIGQVASLTSVTLAEFNGATITCSSSPDATTANAATSVGNCSSDTKTCSGGAMVSRVAPRCEFAACPTFVATSTGTGNVGGNLTSGVSSNAPSTSFSLNGNTVTNGTSITLPSSTATVTWGSTNASSCTFNGENVGTSGTKTLSGITSSSHRYVCTNSTGQSSTLSFSVVVSGGTVTNNSGLSAPIINQFSLDKTSLLSNESTTLTYNFWAPSVASEIPMACNILTYNIAKKETGAGNTLTYGLFSGTRVYEAKDYPSGATISVECRNPAGSVSRSVDLKVVGSDQTTPSTPIVSFAINNIPVTNGTSITLPSSTATVTWGSTNASSCTFNGDNVGTSGTKTLSGITSSSHRYVCTNSTGQSSTLTFSVVVPQVINWINASKQCSLFVGVSSSLIISGPNPIPANYTVGTISYQYDSSNNDNIRNINTSGCSAPVAPVINWIDASTQCSRFAGVSSPLIISGPNPIPANYTVGTMSYQYDSSNNNNIRNINTSGCSAPVITWVNASAQCSAWVGATSPLITSGPNPIPSNYSVGTISYQYDSSNINNLRSINTSGCSAPVAPVINWIDASTQCSRFAGVSSPLIISGPNPIPANYTVGTMSYQYDSSNNNNIRNINTSGCSAPVAVAPTEGGVAFSGSQTFTITDVTTSTGAANSALSTLGRSIQDAFNVVNTNIFEQGRGALSLLSGATKVSASTNSSKSCVNLSSNLHRGNETKTVSKLQSFLIGKGLLSEKASGFFGDLTIEAVKAYQRSVGLPETGMVYGATREAIVRETCK